MSTGRVGSVLTIQRSWRAYFHKIRRSVIAIQCLARRRIAHQKASHLRKLRTYIATITLSEAENISSRNFISYNVYFIVASYTPAAVSQLIHYGEPPGMSSNLMCTISGEDFVLSSYHRTEPHPTTPNIQINEEILMTGLTYWSIIVVTVVDSNPLLVGRNEAIGQCVFRSYDLDALYKSGSINFRSCPLGPCSVPVRSPSGRLLVQEDALKSHISVGSGNIFLTVTREYSMCGWMLREVPSLVSRSQLKSHWVILRAKSLYMFPSPCELISNGEVVSLEEVVCVEAMGESGMKLTCTDGVVWNLWWPADIPCSVQSRWQYALLRCIPSSAEKVLVL